MSTKHLRLLSPTSYSSHYEEYDTTSSLNDSTGSYVPPRMININTTNVESIQVAPFDRDDEDTHTTPTASDSEDDGWKTFPPMIVMPSLWQWILFATLAILATLAFTVLKDPLEKSIGLTSEHILKFGSIPLISVVFTYVHIWMALWMTFYPINYFGICQIPGTNMGLGWQGIVPFKSEEMARMATRLMTQRLFNIREVFARLEPHQVAAEMGPALHTTLDEIISGVARLHSPDLWDLLPISVKTELINKAHEDAPPAIAEMMLTMQDHITEVFDIEDMVVKSLMKDKALLCNIFISCGYKELGSVKKSAYSRP